MNRRNLLPNLLAGLALLAVVALHATSIPRTIWEYDENLYAMGVEHYEPLLHHPPPPGTPLYMGFAIELASLIPIDTFHVLVITSILGLLAGLVAFTFAFREISGNLAIGVAGAVLLYSSPALLISGTVPQSDSGALALLGIAIWACARRKPVAIGIFCAAAIGWRLQFSIAVVPLLLASVVMLRTWRDRAIAVGVFGAACLAWFVPLVMAAGGPASWWHWLSGQAADYAEHDSHLSRSGVSAGQIAVRFLAHAWGPKWLSIPILLLALGGLVAWWRPLAAWWRPLAAWCRPLVMWCRPLAVWRRSRSGRAAAGPASVSVEQDRRPAAGGTAGRWPMLVSSVVYFAFALATMDPADAVRYAIPALPFIALLAATALRRAPWLAILYAAGAYAYAFPVLHARATSDAPPAAAAAWIRSNVPRDAVILYDLSLGPHVDYLLRGRRKSRADVDPAVPAVVFADGERGDAPGVTFRWPDSDAYRKLTRQHYGAVSVILLPRAQRFRVIEGVYAPERLRDGMSWRWLGARAVIELPDLGMKTVRLVFRAPPDSPFENNRVRIGNATVNLGRDATAEVTVPYAPYITIEPERSFVPANIAGANNRDTRTLSVMLTKVEQR